MDTKNDNGASGYLMDSFEGIDREFTDVEVVCTSETNVVARGKRYGRWWMLKGLRSEVADDVGYQQRLRKELEILTELEHPNIVSAVGLEKVEGLGECIVMEYVDGEAIGRRTKDKKRVLEELLDAVEYCHKKGVVHRDLKPENVLVTRNGGHVKLVDFGLADTDSHAVLKQPAGTRGYMSPEQMEKAVPDVRNDIYSLGVLMEEMGMGLRYRGVIRRCKGPIEKRYKNVEEMRKGMRGRWWLWGVGMLLIVIVVGSILNPEGGSLTESRNHRITESRRAAHYSPENSEKPANTAQPSSDIRHQTSDIKVSAQPNCQLESWLDSVAAATGMDEHLDTLSDIMYLRADYADVMEAGMSWADEAMRSSEACRKMSDEEKEEVRKRLEKYVWEKTDGWARKILILKEKYDRSVVKGN